MSRYSDPKPAKPSHIAYAVEEGGDERNHWHKIGAAWETDGGYAIKLSATPVDGRIALRSREALEAMRAKCSFWGQILHRA